jgi:hypothetical protein
MAKRRIFRSPKTDVSLQWMRFNWNDDPDWWICLDNVGQIVTSAEEAQGIIDILSAFIAQEKRDEEKHD